MEKLKPNVVALSLGITAMIIYIACLIIIAILPVSIIINLTNYLVHGIDVSSIAAKDITLAGSIIGLIESFLIAAVIGYIFAFVHNWLNEKIK